MIDEIGYPLLLPYNLGISGGTTGNKDLCEIIDCSSEEEEEMCPDKCGRSKHMHFNINLLVYLMIIIRNEYYQNISTNFSKSWLII